MCFRISVFFTPFSPLLILPKVQSRSSIIIWSYLMSHQSLTSKHHGWIRSPPSVFHNAFDVVTHGSRGCSNHIQTIVFSEKMCFIVQQWYVVNLRGSVNNPDRLPSLGRTCHWECLRLAGRHCREKSWLEVLLTTSAWVGPRSCSPCQLGRGQSYITRF